MKTTICTAEAFAYGMMVPSILDTLRMISGALATTSTYTVVVCSMWGSSLKMELNGREAHATILMALRRNMNGD